MSHPPHTPSILRAAPAFAPLALIVLTAIATPASAAPRESLRSSFRDFHWALRAGTFAQNSYGDFDGRAVLQANPGTTDTAATEGTLPLPAWNPTWGFSFGLGSRMDRHRVSFAIATGSAVADHDSSGTWNLPRRASLLQIGFDYRNDLMPKSALRPSLGGGLQFIYRDLQEGFRPATTSAPSAAPTRARYSGTGLSLAAGLGYWQPHWGLTCEASYLFTTYRNIGIGSDGFTPDGALIDHAGRLSTELWLLL